MTVTFPCPGCGKTLRVREEMAGRRGKCPKCGAVFGIPAEGPAPVPTSGADGRASGDVPDARPRPVADVPAPTAPTGAPARVVPDVTVTVPCGPCKKDYTLPASTCVLTVQPTDRTKPACPTCKKASPLPFNPLGCPSCWGKLWVLSSLMGRTIACPHCRSRLELPSSKRHEELVGTSGLFHWSVRRAVGGDVLRFDGLESLVAAMKAGKVGPVDTCVQHEFGVPGTLRETCKRHPALRKLYDPVGVYCSSAAIGTGVAFAAIYLVAWFVGGLIQWGGAFLLFALFGVLGAALTPTFIGLLIVYIIARACGIPLLGAYLGVLLVALTTVVAFGIGAGLAYGVTRVIAGLTGLHRRRVVAWD